MRNLKIPVVLVVISALGSLVGCMSDPRLSPEAVPDPASAYIVVRLTSESVDVSASLTVRSEGSEASLTIPFLSSGSIGIYEIQPGRIILEKVTVNAHDFSLALNPLGQQPITLQPGEVCYIGDWAVYREGDYIGYRKPLNLGRKALAAIQAGHPVFTGIPWKSIFSGDEDVEPGTLERGQLTVRTEQAIESALHPRPFFQAQATLDLMEGLDLWQDLDDQERILLMKHFFAALPAADAGEVVVKEAVIGGLMITFKDLSVHLAFVPLRKEEEGSGGLYSAIVLANASILRTVRGTVRMASAGSIFQRKYIVFPDGRLVSPENLPTQENFDKQKTSNDPLTLVNFTDTLVKRGLPEDFELARSILDSLIATPGTQKKVLATARLNSMMLACAEGRLDDASEICEQLSRQNLFGLDDTFQQVIKVQAPALLRLVRAAADGPAQ
jgi:hypothetical protein